MFLVKIGLTSSLDFYHFHAAVTRQAILHSALASQCSLTLKRSGLHIHAPILELFGVGQIQIWRQIGNDEYKVRTPIVPFSSHRGS